MFQVIRKADIILLVVLLLLGGALSWYSIAGRVTGQTVVVSVDGKEYARYQLDTDQKVTIRHNGHTNKFSIKDGKVQMTEASCKNHVCIKDGAISQTNQSIVCLPNRVTIEIEGGAGQYDVISK